MIAITTPLADARLSSVATFLDTGANNAAVRIYGETRPATPTDTPTSELLVQISLAKPCGVVSAGTLTLSQLEDGLINATGTATWARVVNADGAAAFDCDCGEGIGAWEVRLAQVALFAGGAARITSAVLG